MNEYTLTLILNILSVIICIVASIRSYNQKKLIVCIYWSVFLFLVCGQAMDITLSLKSSFCVVYLNNVISMKGHFFASILLLYILIMIIILSKVVDKNRYFVYKKNTYKEKYKMIYNTNKLYYIINWILLIALTFLLINLIGGLKEWINSDRPYKPGGTFLIIGMGIFTYPLIIKIINKYKISINDILLYVVSTLIIVSFSRIYGIFHIFILIISMYYININNTKIGFKKFKTAFIISGLVVILIFFVYGTYRNTRNFIKTDNIKDIYLFIKDNPDKSLLSLSNNYKIGIEGMTGFSGVLSNFLQYGQIKFDLGLSVLSAFIKMIPSFFRNNLIQSFLDILSNLYWYKGSIISGGLECFFVHFSFLGVIIYPMFFYLFSYKINDKLILLKNRNYNINTKFIKSVIISVYGLQLIRGTTTNLVFYTICEIIVMYLAVYLFKFVNSVKIQLL